MSGLFAPRDAYERVRRHLIHPEISLRREGEDQKKKLDSRLRGKVIGRHKESREPG